jgi:hypothetical protein
MYLTGRKFMTFDAPKREEDGYEIEQIEVKIGYWRKHPNLHGYIVETFAGGEDKCQDIDLDMKQIEQTMEAIKADELPDTDGFFFGKSHKPGEKDADLVTRYEEQKTEDLEIFALAVAWLTRIEPKEKCYRSVVYRASW